jgi:aldehyde dehydrogenase (NAD+)
MWGNHSIGDVPNLMLSTMQLLVFGFPKIGDEMAPSSSKFISLQKAATTRQCSNAYCRQEALKSLHDALRSKPLDIISAIQDDTNTSHMAASTEFAYGLDLVESHYKSINPANELEREYRVARNEDDDGKKEPWGTVYIHPDQSHTPFFSIIAALSAALAAGNVVVLKVSAPIEP